MASQLDLRGVYVPLVTPFTTDDAVAYDELERLAAHCIDEGVAGLVALGTTGEPATLDAPEKAKVIEVIGAVCQDRGAHFSVGAGTNSTKASLALVDAACAAGAQSILSVVPYYTRPAEAGIVDHFKTLAASSSVPIIVYNVPHRTGRGLGAESLLELAEVPGIAGLKQAVGGIDSDTLAVLAGRPDGFHVLGGDDPFIYPLMALGGSGTISASANAAPAAFTALVDAASKSEFDRAIDVHNVVLPLAEALFDEPSPAVTKAVLHAEGHISTPNLRAPMTPASPSATQRAVALNKTVTEFLAHRQPE